MKKRYKILSIILALVIALGSIITISIVSSSAEEHFTDENGIEWTVTENYPGWAIKPTTNAGISGDVVIPSEYDGSPINTIDTNAFIGCTNLTGISIPNSITLIDRGAFQGCTGLTSISIPESVTEISYAVFLGCTGLTDVKLPNNITLLSCFSGCTGLTSITIPSSVTTLGGFDGCTGLSSISIPDSVTEIRDYAFEDCTGLTSISIPDSVSSIGTSAFRGCTKLNTINLGNKAKTIGVKAFYNTGWYNSQADGIIYLNDLCLGYKGDKPTGNLVITDGTTAVAGQAFYNCTGLTSVTIPDSLKTINDSAFLGCTKITALDLHYGVETIGRNAFKTCTGLTRISIPDSVTEIDNGAFQGCTGLTSISIPDSVSSIGTGAFQGCTKLNTINLGNKAKTIDFNAFYNTGWYNSQADGLIYLDNHLLDYKGTPPTGEIVIADGTISIAGNAFDSNGLTSVIIPSGVEIIGHQAFDCCKGLTSVTIPDSVTKICSEAFFRCSNLTSLDLGNGVETIGELAFAKTNLTNISIPSSVKKIESEAFAYNGLIENLTVNCSFDVIATTAFYDDTFLNVILGSEVDTLGDEFSNMDTLESIVIPNTVTNIKDTAFTGSNNVTITTPANSTAHKFAESNNIPVIPVESADITKLVDFEVTCDKSGYEFTVYRVADLESGVNPYEIRYDSLIADIEDEIFEGDSVALLEELDKVDSSLLTEVVGTYNTDVDGSSKLFENLPAGIYYVRATNFPANVYSVQNSVFALPYYVEDANWWTYDLSPIPLATKVDESNPEIVKTITNSTKDNVNFTDVSLGDTVNFEIEASRVGSANVVESKDFRLNSYVVSDIMENGLTLNQDSFVVTLEDADGNTLTTLEDTTDYVVNIVANDGADTTFTVSLTPEYLQEDEFYSSANVVIAYSAVLNKYSTREFDGNYNTATNLTYSNKTNVSATVEGNTVYAYTFGIEVNKYDDAGTPLAGSQFGLYLTEDDAKDKANAIATGTSTDTGKVEFFTESNDVIRLASGTYYIVETKATESYNRYTDVIPVTITVNYGDTEVNGTYIESAPENGIQLVEVKNSKVVIPNTGGDGAMYRYLIALAFAMLAVTLFVVKKRSSKKATATK